MEFGQIIEVALGAVQEALAGKAARTDGDLALGDVIAGAARIAFGIEEDQHALALIIMQHGPRHRQHRRHRRGRRAEQPQPHAGQEQHHNAAKQDRQGRAQIGLQHHQPHRHGDQRQRRDQHIGPAFIALGDILIIARQHQHDGQLHHFGWLELHDADIQPALAAAAHGAGQFHAHQRHQQRDVDGPGPAQPAFGRHQRKGQRAHQQDGKTHALFQRPGVQGSASGRIEHDQAKTGDGADDQHHAPRQAGQFAAPGSVEQVHRRYSGSRGGCGASASAISNTGGLMSSLSQLGIIWRVSLAMLAAASFC